MNILEIAEYYVARGLSVIPVKADSSKSPLIAGWRLFSNQLPTKENLRHWFQNRTDRGIGIVPGPASGNLVILDFEHDGRTSAYEEFIARLPADLLEVSTVIPTVRTPSGGRHMYVRLPDSQPGTKLCRYAGGKTKIEIRGAGHQVLAPGCPLECHQSGLPYEWEIDADIIELDMETWSRMLIVCSECNEFVEEPKIRDRGVVGGSTGIANGAASGEESPGNDFNIRGSWEETGLFDCGWTWARQLDTGRGFLTRPGKVGGVSASVGMTTSKTGGYPYFYAFTTSSEFTADTPYSKFAVYAQLKFSGDFGAAASQLRKSGFGGDRPEVPDVAINLDATVKPPVVGPSGACFRSPTKWLSECQATSEDVNWLVKGYIRRGGITMFSALWKIGKSTWLSNMLKAMDGSVDNFIGQPVRPCRVLYVTEEDEKIWADRRDQLIIGDHVAMCVRPFTTKPTAEKWGALIDAIAEDVERHRFDLVVFDTLSKMWPVEDENHAGQVEKALMPLWRITKDGEGAAVLLVHHTRKSGGDEFVAARGSGGLPAFCEILMEFKRSESGPTRREIKAIGRYTDIPDSKVCDWVAGKYIEVDPTDDKGGVKINLGKKKEEPEEYVPVWMDDLKSVITNAGESWYTFPEIADAVAARRNGVTVRKEDLLKKGVFVLMDQGFVERQGGGHKGSSYLYRLKQA